METPFADSTMPVQSDKVTVVVALVPDGPTGDSLSGPIISPGSSVSEAIPLILPRRVGYSEPFPVKLHTMLQDAIDDEESSHILTWTQEGNEFTILKPKEFAANVLPSYFRSEKFTSFQRQLNAYGFRRCDLYGGHDSAHTYRHDVFTRDSPELLSTINRRRPRASMSYPLLEIKRGAELPMSFPPLPVIFSEATLEIEGDASCGNASAAFQSSMQSMWHHWNTNTEATFSA
jgi:hypothetical protein